MKNKKFTIKEVAKDCGVSASTVSLVMNDNPRIPEKTRQKVLSSIQKLNYVPNSWARGLAAKSTRVLAVILPDLPQVMADPYFGKILSGIFYEARKAGYRVRYEIATEEFVGGGNHLALFRQRSIDGMMYVGSTLQDHYLMDFLEGSFPFLQVNSYFRDLQLNSIASDYCSGTKMGLEHLWKLGHRKIGLMMGAKHIRTSLDVFETYQEFLKEKGIGFDPSLLVEGDFSEEDGFAYVEPLWLKQSSSQEPMTAILFGNDRMAIGALKKLNEMGVRVPEEVAVMGMDGLDMGAYTVPSLTSVVQPLFEMGVESVRTLLSLIDKSIEIPVEKFLKMELQIRESCGALSASDEKTGSISA